MAIFDYSYSTGDDIRGTENIQFKVNNVFLTDKDGTNLCYKDILFNGSDYYCIHAPNEDGSIDMISCTKGYIHNVTQEILNNFELIGFFSAYKHLLECD